jgi:membrane protein YfhO
VIRAALIYAVLSLVLVSPALPSGRTLSASDGLWQGAPWNSERPGWRASNSELSDQYVAFQPFLAHTRAELPHIPLWNPHLMGGRPFLGNGQSAIFSPFNSPAYVLPFWRSLAFIAALKLFVAALGTFLLARALGMRFPGALLSGVVFAFSLWFVVWLSWPTTSSWALLPWLWLCADRLARRPDPLWVCGLAATTALMLLGGHPESYFQVLAATTVFFVLRCVGRHDLPKRGAAFAGGIALGAGLAALALVPLIELFQRSADSASRGEFADLHTPGRFLLGLFLHDFWGRPTRISTLLFGPFLHTRAYYVGALTLMLVAAALIFRRDLLRIGLAAMGLLCLLIAVGLPPLPDLLGVLPGFKVTNNTRLVVVFVLCAALLAGWGLNDLSGRLEVPRARWVPAAGLVLLVIPLIWIVIAGDRPWASVLWDSFKSAWLFQYPDLHVRSLPELQRLGAEIQASALLEWLVLAGAGVVLLWLRVTRRLAPTPFAALAVALVVLDLFKAGVGINPSISTADAVQPATPAIQRLQADRPARFAGLAGDPLRANLAMRYGLYDARGYDFPIEERYFNLWRLAIASPGCGYHFCTSGATATPRALQALGLLGVKDLLATPSDTPLPNLDTTYSGPDGRIYTNPYAVPRAFVVGRQEVAGDGDAALAAVTAQGFEATHAAVTEEPVAGVPRGPGGASSGSARIVSYEDAHVVLEADAPGPSLLVLTDSYAPGWKATVDGRSVPIHRVDYLLRGVQAGPGSHRVEFRYEPSAWRIGLAISAISLLVLLALLAYGLVRRRNLSS